MSSMDNSVVLENEEDIATDKLQLIEVRFPSFYNEIKELDLKKINWRNGLLIELANKALQRHKPSENMSAALSKGRSYSVIMSLVILGITAIVYQQISSIVALGSLIPVINIGFAIILFYYVFERFFSS